MSALEGFMDWSEQALHALLRVRALEGAILQMAEEAGAVDMVILDEPEPEALYAARALIVVHKPQMAMLALEAWATTITPASVGSDPLLREWWDRRARGEPAAVRDLPADYVLDLLMLVGESKDGERLGRFFTIGGLLPERTFTRYEPGDTWSFLTPLYPLFLQPKEGHAEELLRASQEYLAHGRTFHKLYEAER